MADQLKIQRTPQLDEAMRILTDGTFRQMTGNKVPALNRSQAAALLGNIVHETGSPDLRNLDVVERDGGAGRAGGTSNVKGRISPAKNQLRIKKRGK